jgi:hypothetical protein
MKQTDLYLWPELFKELYHNGGITYVLRFLQNKALSSEF